MAALMLPGQFLLAQPGGGVVTSGAAVIERAGAVTDINQSTNKASINWQSFNIKPNETVNFNQPGRSSVTLNRVIGNERSVLEGALNANGQVFLINSSGVLATKTSSINTGGFVASTLNITDEDFQAGRYIFNSNGKNSSVINQGTITARDGGYVALLGGMASNQGVITATKGTVTLASGDKIRLNLNDATLSGVIIDEGTLNALVENNEAIYADGGRVFLTAKAANDLLASQINMNGVIRAQTVGELKGSIEINALGGETYIAGTLDAAGNAGILPASGGGFIETSGDRVTIADSATITTKAANGRNGEWLIDPDGFTIGATTNDGDMSAAALNANLKNGNVTIASTSGKGSDGNINVNGAVSWSENTLTLNATNNVFINNVVTATGKASLTATYGNGTNKDETPMGLYTTPFDANSRLDFSGTGALTLGGERYTVINSADQLNAARSNPAGHYALGSNINLSSITNWTSLDNNAASGFTGKFNGFGHQIDNFKSTNASFWGTISANAVINNFKISNTANIVIDFANTNTSIGILANVNRGRIVNVNVSGTLKIATNINTVGGLVGINHGLIVQSYSAAPIHGVTNTTGGLVGINENTGNIVDSYVTGSILNALTSKPTSGYVGGLIGINHGTIQHSYAIGRITLDGATDPALLVGGFVGKNTGTINESYTSGGLSTAPRFGGFVGENIGTIENAYTTRLNNVGASGNWDAGFVYKNSGAIRNAYATMYSGNMNSLRYGFARENTGLLENTYYYVEEAMLFPGQTPTPVSEVNPTSGATRLSKAIASNFSSYKFDLGIWAESQSGYPILRNIPVLIESRTVPGYGSATSSIDSLGLRTIIRGLQGGGGIDGYGDSIDIIGCKLTTTCNPFIVTIPNGSSGSYIDAGVWNALDILSSVYTNIRGVIRVNPKTLTISGVVENKTYDGTTTATLKSGVAKNGLVGLVGSQTLDVAYTSAAFQNKNAGTGKVADISYTVADGTNGGKASNYAIADTTTATITPKPVSVVIVGNGKTYDGTTAATVATQVSGVIAGDELAAIYQSASFTNKNSGNQTVTVSGLSLTGEDSGNYTISGGNTATTSAAITPRPLQLYGVANEGGSLTVGADNLSAANIVEGDSVRLGGSVGIASSAAGSQPIKDFSALTVNNPNYTVIGSVGSILIGGANLVFDRVTEGNASVAVSGKTTTVIQTTDKASIDWLRFSLNEDESLEFKQPSSSSIVLNRVVTDLPSVVAGTLRANGRVFILNAGGILFTAKSHVNVGALVASTFNLTDEDFLNNNYVFRAAGGTGSVIAEGDIVIAESGFLALASQNDVKQTGTISGGATAALVSSSKITLDAETGGASDIQDLTGKVTLTGAMKIGTAKNGGRLVTAGDTVTANSFNLDTGKSGAWEWTQNGGVTIGEGAFSSGFTQDNLASRDFQLTTRQGDINVNAALDWTANTTLGLSAKNDIFINKPIKATGATAGLIMDYGGDYHLITPATFSGAVLDATGKPVAQTIPTGTEFSNVTLSGGNATLKMNGNDYTVIRNMEEFAALSPSNADATGTATGYFALAQDLDASAWSAAHTGTPSVVASLSGTLTGLGHTVSNLTLNAPTENNVGLIGQMTANTGTANILRDIGVVNADITGAVGVGVLAGQAEDTSVGQAYTTGKIAARSRAGSLLGTMTGQGIYDNNRYVSGPQIENSYAGVDITATLGELGGLVGGAHTVTITGSHATGNITGPGAVYYYVDRDTNERIPMYDERGLLVEHPVGNNYYISLSWASQIGGLLGYAAYANVGDSYATGNITSIDGEQIGGLIGVITGEWSPKPFSNAVVNSFETGNVVGGYKVGGLIGEVGYLLLTDTNPMTVDNAYATGNVTGTREYDPILGTDGGMIGGLIGSSVRSNISNSHATGNVFSVGGYNGGLVGYQSGGSISDSYATGTVIGYGGHGSENLVGGGHGTVSGSYYTNANVAAAAEVAPVRSETGRIADDVRLNESESTRKERKNTNGTRGDGRSGSSLASYIYQEDEGSYSARVKAVEVECAQDEEGCER